MPKLKKKMKAEPSDMVPRSINIHRSIQDKVLARIEREKSSLKLKRCASFNGVVSELLQGYGEGRFSI